MLIIVSYNIKIDDKCVLGVKFSYVKFIFQMWKYVYNTFNVLLFTPRLTN
jgi:hypothetical protein